MPQPPDAEKLRIMTTDLVAAYVVNNHLPANELPGLINTLHEALFALIRSTSTSAAEYDPTKPSPAEIRKSIRPDGLVSFLDGKTYKTLRRHLSSRGLDPDSYRVKFGLPADYPMTAPNYSARRSELAKGLGLGQRPAVQMH